MTAIQQALSQAYPEASDRRPHTVVARARRHCVSQHRVSRHWAFGLVLTAGMALRVLTQLAYRPALLYIDSAKYLVGSAGSEPEGYQALLRTLDPLGGIALVAAAQHLFGLALSVTLYMLLIRYGVPRWLATVAAASVLLDAYQLQLEQTIMPDVFFEALIGAGLAVLLWPQRQGTERAGGIRRGQMAAGALILGGASTVREIGGVLVVPVLVFAFVTVAGWRRRAVRTALAAGAFLLPVLAYMGGSLVLSGHFSLGRGGPGPEYGRAAAAADCATLVLPAGERALCPTPAQVRALGGVDGLLHNPDSPGNTVAVDRQEALLARFSLAVVRQQPLRVAASVARDSVRLFALTRDGDPEITPMSRWQFQTFYPTYPRTYSLAFFTALEPHTRSHGSPGDLVAVRPVAAFLRAYQLDGGYTPGPLYLVGLLAGVAGSVAGLWRRKARRVRMASLLVTVSAVVLLAGSDAFEFSWRYQLPAVILLPAAGALGVTAVRTASAGTGRRARLASAGTGSRARSGRPG